MMFYAIPQLPGKTDWFTFTMLEKSKKCLSNKHF
jgi:hypothetical protein